MQQYAYRPFKIILSSKVIDFGTNRKGVCDFLLVINSNFGPILHCFWDAASYWLKIANFSYPTLVWRPRSGGTCQNFWMKLNAQKLEGWGLVYGENRMILTSAVFAWITHVTDRQTDGNAIAYARNSICAVARKKWLHQFHHYFHNYYEDLEWSFQVAKGRGWSQVSQSSAAKAGRHLEHFTRQTLLTSSVIVI